MGIRAKLLGGIGAVAMVAALAATPMAASAAEAEAIVFAGVAGSITPPITVLPGTGTYNFGGNCLAGADTDDPILVSTSGGCTINSNGDFVSVTCGTGLAIGMNVAGFSGGASIAEHDGETVSIQYVIVFVAGTGLELGTSHAADDDTAAGGAVAGVVNIVPAGTPPGNVESCVTGVSAFTVTGVGVGAA